MNSQINAIERLEESVPSWGKLFLKLMSKIDYGTIEIITPNNEKLFFEGEHQGENVQIVINSWSFCEKIFLSGDIGLGESYINGDWDSKHINKVIRFGIQNERILAKVIKGSLLKILFYRFKHLLNRNTKSGSEKNIHAHYDLGNDFYSLWLDKSMTYSSGLFDSSNSLEQSQYKKYQKIIDTLGLKTGDKVLEVGCGWGGFIEYASRQGINVTGVTISKEQYEYAKSRNSEFKSSHILYCDYRDLKGKYDHIVSIEMFEALGKEYWSRYFKKLKSLLRPNGKILIQSITINEKDFKSYSKGTDFIQQYIFPGGMLPSPSIFKKVSKSEGLNVVDQFDFGIDYAKTLDHWDENFSSHLLTVKKLGFNEEFIRTWRFYLKYCQGGFEASKIGVSQFLLES
jgi:cyclopropane-fatty-acyl-phospholipid synthase